MPQPNSQNIAEVGGAGIQLRQGMQKKYIPCKLPSNVSGWRECGFYIGNHEPALPEMTPGAPKIVGEWTLEPPTMDQVNELLERIAKLRKEGVTRASVVYSWIDRHIQPLQKHTKFGFEYIGLLDPSWFSAEKIHQVKL